MWRRFDWWFLWGLKSESPFERRFPLCLYRLFEVSYGCLNIWLLYHKCGSCLTNCEINCEVWRRFDWWFLWGFKRPSERRFPYVSIDFLRWAMTVWIYGDIHMCGSCLTNCEETVRLWRRFDWWFLWGFERPFEQRVFRMSLSTFWGELWLFEYMVVISHMCESCLTELWENCEVLTQIWLMILVMILVRLWKTFQTAFFLCLYRFFEVSYGCLNIWGLYHKCEVASLIAKKMWGVTQVWLMILVRLWKAFRTAFSVCLYRLFEVSYDCLNIWW